MSGDAQAVNTAYVDDFIHFSKILRPGIFEEARRLYASGLSLEQVAARVGKSRNHVRNALIAGGVPPRPSSRCPEGKRARTARTSAGAAPYGFAYLRGRLVADPREAEHLLAMLELRTQGRGCKDIARLLNGRGAPSRKGGPWKYAGVASIMRRHGREPSLAAALGFADPRRETIRARPEDKG